MKLRTLAIMLLALLLGPSPVGAMQQVDASRHVGIVAADRAAAAALRRGAAMAPVARAVRMRAPTAAELAPLTALSTKAGAPLRIGIHRVVDAGVSAPDAPVPWEPTAAGFVTTLSIESPGASALRLALRRDLLPRAAELRFFAPGRPETAEGPYAGTRAIGARAAVRDLFWSPVIEGPVIGVELWMPASIDRRGARLVVERLAHLTRAPLATRDLQDIGSSQGCELDIACDPRWMQTGDAVTKIVFESGAFTGLCTGTLLQDAKPEDARWHVLTAAHCIDTKAVARTATFLWFFERAACDGPSPSTVTQTAGGARMPFTTKAPGPGIPTTDHTLLRLRQPPPDGAVLAGWSAEAADTQLGARVRGLHHPAGDLKMSSRGRTRDLWQWAQRVVGATVTKAEPLTHYEVRWNRGVTEGGSSGSGIFVGNRFPSQHLIGVLTGGSSSCSAPGDPDFYGRFDTAYAASAKLRRLLGAGS